MATEGEQVENVEAVQAAPEQGEPGGNLGPEQDTHPDINPNPSHEELEEISEAELLPEGQAEDPAISGLSHASSSLKDAPASGGLVEEGEFDRIEDTDRPA